MAEKSFEDFGFNRQILNAIEEKGYTTPTPIQEKAIPLIMGGQQFMGIAQTGTGKTAAYVLPIIMKIKYAQGHDPRALILVPTRELAMQVSENITTYAKYTDLRHMAVYGGLGPKAQKEQLAKGIDILIATPGRLLELYLSGDISFKKIQIFVMDEADRLMDMGFISQIHRILEIVPRKRQNMLFSATMSDLVKRIAGDFLEFPTIIQIEPEQKTAATVSQAVYFTPNIRSKINLLNNLLENGNHFSRVMIFCRTKTNADDVFQYLDHRYGAEGVRVIHGNKGQNSRINSINAFKDGEIRILVATDVAARGIDVSLVSHVINFDVPIISEDYVHRIGRTGRALAEGESITFCTESEVYHLKKIQKLIKQTVAEKKIPRNVFIEETPYEEQQNMNKEIDMQKRKEDPDFKGAFHDKKPIGVKKEKPQKRSHVRQSKRAKNR
jgi:ATP-dependent RNA helicase RhlE